MIQPVTSSADPDFAGNLLCDLSHKPLSQWTLNDAITVWLCWRKSQPNLDMLDLSQFKLAALWDWTQMNSGKPPVSSPSATCDPPTCEGEKSSAGDSPSPQLSLFGSHNRPDWQAIAR